MNTIEWIAAIVVLAFFGGLACLWAFFTADDDEALRAMRDDDERK